MKLARVSRLVRLISLLQSGKGFNTDQLAHECQVGRRTTFRDLATLREAGVPLHFDQQRQTYRIPGASLLPPTSFTSEEALALIGLAQELGQNPGLPFYEPARRAALKLESSLPVKLRDYLREVRPAVSIQLAPVNPLADSQPYFERAKEAVLDALAALAPESRTALAEVKEEMRKTLRRYFKKTLERRPVILPVVMEL